MGAGVGEDCAAVKLAADEMFVLSTDPITGTVEDIGKLAIQITLNDLASAGAAPIGVLLTILLPEDTTEAGLTEMMAQVEEACHAADVQVMGGHTEVTAAVNRRSSLSAVSERLRTEKSYYGRRKSREWIFS